MKVVSRKHIIPADSHHQVKEPVVEVDLGERFVVQTINMPNGITRVPDDVKPEVWHERGETGPIFVRGIEPGDVLAIHIEDIRPEGHACGGTLHGADKPTFHRIDGDRVHFPGGLWAKKHMMIGDIYITPRDRPFYVNPYDHGGNMDFKDVSIGNVLMLKAELEGGLLALGDCHAAQGDGEMLGAACECAAEVELTITKDQTFLSDRPLIKKPESFVALACRRPYSEARDLAIDDAARVLSRLKGCTWSEA